MKTPAPFANRSALAVYALAGTACALSACALVPQRTVDTRGEPLPEEVARRLETVRGERTEYPSFRDIPSTPTDVRTPAQWAQSVADVKGEGRALTAWAAANPPEVADVAAYAAQARAGLGVGPQDAPPVDQDARTEALARSMRFTPPPPIP
jgi:hypothetical protein